MNSTGRAPGQASRTAWRTIASALGIGLILFGAGWALLLANRTTETSSDTFTEELSAINVDNSSGRIVIRGSDTADETTVEREFVSSFVPPREEINVTGDGELEITTRCGGPGGWGWFGTCDARYEIVVPADVVVRAHAGAGRAEATGPLADVSVESGAGSVMVRGANGSVTARASAGSATVRDITGTDVEVSSSAGHVSVVDVNVTGELLADASAGGVDVDRVAARRIEATSSAGSVNVATDGAFEELHADASAGSVTVQVPRSRGPYDVDAHASAGSVNLDIAQSSTSASKIVAHSSAGPVTVQER